MTFDIPRYTLNDGQSVPVIGFGTYPLRGDDGVEAMVHALEAGYRLLDTAVNYGNEEEVGEAVRRSGLAREDVQVTSKIPGRHHEYDQAIGSVEQSLRRMRFDYLDRVLIHWPNPGVGKYVEAWGALVELRNRGLVRSIGVSNFTEQHLHAVIEDTGVTPAVNQIELHPYFPQQEMLRVHTDLGIQTEAWSPLGKRSAPFAEPPVSEPTERYGVTPARSSALAPAAPLVAAAQVGDAAAATTEPRPLRVRAHRRRGRRDHRAGPSRRAAVRRRPGQSPRDVGIRRQGRAAAFRTLRARRHVESTTIVEWCAAFTGILGKAGSNLVDVPGARSCR